jgi:hypothetical protein
MTAVFSGRARTRTGAKSKEAHLFKEVSEMAWDNGW